MGTDDPVQTVRTMLDVGEVRRAGETTRDGRRVLRLVADPPARRDAPRHTERARTVYLIDAETYAPVEIEQRLLMHSRGGRRVAGPITRISFQRYERLPVTPENERLLQLSGKR